VPSYIEVVEAIPKTASQKNLGRVLQDEFDAEAANVYKFEDFK
jgi:acyl-coenzyme A synthetase/AMP-(fatty) acid ligase